MRLKLADVFMYIIILSVLLFLVTIIVMVVEPSSFTAKIPVDAVLNSEDPDDHARSHENATKVADNGVTNLHNPGNLDISNAINQSAAQNLATSLTTLQVNLSYCDNIINKRRDKALALQKTDVHTRPPWIELIASDNVTNSSSIASTSNKTYYRQSNLYVQVFAAHTRRLGNQLFNYASLFGIAWRNQRVPLWPDRKTQLRNAFNLRIPIDQKNAVIDVSATV